MSIESKLAEQFEKRGLVGVHSSTKTSNFEKIKRRCLMGISNLLPEIDPFFALKNRMYGFGYVGENVRIRSGMKCSNPENIFLFAETFINYNCTVLAKSPVLIGRMVAIGPNVSFYTVEHRLDDKSLRFLTYSSPIIVGDYSWIGGNAVVLSGVDIAPRSVIGAGSVVTRDTEEGWVYAGNPARKLKKIN